MRATGWLQRNGVEVLWGLFAVSNWVAMIAWPAWETIPFHFVWISLTIVYGFRVWSPGVTGVILGTVIVATGASILSDAFQGIQLAVQATSAAEAERLFAALTPGGTVTMPLGKTFWSPAFGMVDDRFGVTWMVNTAG